MAPVLILSAMVEEIQSYLSHATVIRKRTWNTFEQYEGILFGKEVVIARCGVGKTLSAAGAQRLLDLYHPSRLIFTGLAGAIDPSLEVGDIVVGVDSLQHDMEAEGLGWKRGAIPYTSFFAFPSDKSLVSLALSAPTSGFKIYPGRILTGDQFITGAKRESHTYLSEELKGTAVEMEGASVGLVAMLNEVPYLLFRTISDKADHSAAVNFAEFLPRASEHAALVLRHVLEGV